MSVTVDWQLSVSVNSFSYVDMIDGIGHFEVMCFSFVPLDCLTFCQADSFCKLIADIGSITDFNSNQQICFTK